MPVPKVTVEDILEYECVRLSLCTTFQLTHHSDCGYDARPHASRSNTSLSAGPPTPSADPHLLRPSSAPGPSPGASVRTADSLVDIRAALASPTPLAALLHDMDGIRALAASTGSTLSTPSTSRSRSRRPGREPASPRASAQPPPERSGGSERRQRSGTRALLSLVLAESERQAHDLRGLLRLSDERANDAQRRADAAEARAVRAEEALREVRGRATRVEETREAAVAEAARAKEECARATARAEAAEREERRLGAENGRLERERRDADTRAGEARDLARKWQGALRDHQSWTDGREEGRMLALRRRYDDGRDEGFEEGREEGFAEGFAEGRAEGLDEGRQVGRMEERRAAEAERERTASIASPSAYAYASPVARSAPIAMPAPEIRLPADVRRNFLSIVVEGRFDLDFKQRHERIRQWAESADESLRSVPVSPPKARPAWLRRRIQTEPRLSDTYR
jgi:hypothetical protein